jgi:hypothetical protein
MKSRERGPQEEGTESPKVLGQEAAQCPEELKGQCGWTWGEGGEEKVLRDD